MNILSIIPDEIFINHILACLNPIELYRYSRVSKKAFQQANNEKTLQCCYHNNINRRKKFTSKLTMLWLLNKYIRRELSKKLLCTNKKTIKLIRKIVIATVIDIFDDKFSILCLDKYALEQGPQDLKKLLKKYHKHHKLISQHGLSLGEILTICCQYSYAKAMLIINIFIKDIALLNQNVLSRENYIKIILSNNPQLEDLMNAIVYIHSHIRTADDYIKTLSKFVQSEVEAKVVKFLSSVVNSEPGCVDMLIDLSTQQYILGIISLAHAIAITQVLAKKYTDISENDIFKYSLKNTREGSLQLAKLLLKTEPIYKVGILQPNQILQFVSNTTLNEVRTLVIDLLDILPLLKKQDYPILIILNAVNKNLMADYRLMLKLVNQHYKLFYSDKIPVNELFQMSHKSGQEDVIRYCEVLSEATYLIERFNLSTKLLRKCYRRCCNLSMTHPFSRLLDALRAAKFFWSQYLLDINRIIEQIIFQSQDVNWGKDRFQYLIEAIELLPKIQRLINTVQFSFEDVRDSFYHDRAFGVLWFVTAIERNQLAIRKGYLNTQFLAKCRTNDMVAIADLYTKFCPYFETNLLSPSNLNNLCKRHGVESIKIYYHIFERLYPLKIEGILNSEASIQAATELTLYAKKYSFEKGLRMMDLVLEAKPLITEHNVNCISLIQYANKYGLDSIKEIVKIMLIMHKFIQSDVKLTIIMAKISEVLPPAKAKRFSRLLSIYPEILRGQIVFEQIADLILRKDSYFNFFKNQLAPKRHEYNYYPVNVNKLQP